MARGDKIRVLLDTGSGESTMSIIEATLSGEKVAFSREDRKNLVTVEVLNRNDRPVRTYEFRADRVLMIGEEPGSYTAVKPERKKN
jgi:hypothetical protein